MNQGSFQKIFAAKIDVRFGAYFFYRYQPLLFLDIAVIYMLPECNEKTNDNNGTEKVTIVSSIQV